MGVWLTFGLCASVQCLIWVIYELFQFFASICSSAGLPERFIHELPSGDCCPPICANHINSDFKSEFHPFHLSSVIQRPTQRVALFTSAHSASHLDLQAEFYNAAKTKRQKDKKTKRQKDKKTKRQSLILWCQGSFKLLECVSVFVSNLNLYLHF